MEVTNIEELNEAIDNGLYDVEYVRARFINADTVIDEHESVWWNKEEVLRLNEEMKFKVDSYRDKKREMDLKLDRDVIRAYAVGSGYSEYSKDKIEVLYNYAYEESHSSGINEILQTLEELIELLQRVDEKD